jgi:hypothetical protein
MFASRVSGHEGHSKLHVCDGADQFAVRFLTFFVLLKVFHAGESMFQTGWFIESMATQVLVIFIIRTTKNPFRSRPNGWLMDDVHCRRANRRDSPADSDWYLFRIRCAAAGVLWRCRRNGDDIFDCGGRREAMVLCPHGKSSGLG